MYELPEAWERRLKRDLEGFADRGDPPVVEREGNTLHAGWSMRGRKQSEIFGLGPRGALRWLSSEGDDESYEAFLQSEGLGDFPQLARAITRAIGRQTPFVPSDAVVDAGVDRRDQLSATPAALADHADRGRLQAEGRTNLFFLMGDPGAGKSTLLREVTAFQAERYLDGESEFLFFYVSAQGRELSNLRDAFSGELQDLRAAFTRDAIAALVRAGLLIPVVDGFDELLGTAGYGGAFSSLQTLLADLEGLGALVVSARSAFYELEFLGRSSSPANEADISTTTIGLQPWTDEQLHEYLRKGNDPSVSHAAERLSEPDRQLLRRPFFASQFPGFASSTDEQDSLVGLLQYLITAYIEREAVKIVDASGDPILPVDGHHRLFELTASEMWEAEARQLAVDDLRALTELVAEEFDLDGDGAAQLATKVTSYAGFRPRAAGAAEEFAFEHEVYFNYFLAQAVRRLLDEGRFPDLMSFLDRGVLPGAISSDVVPSLERVADVKELLHCPAGISYENRRANMGALVAAYAREISPITETEIRNLAFVKLVVGSCRFGGVEFTECDFFGADLSGTVFENCSGESSRFNAIVLDNESRMGMSGLQPGRNVGSIRHPETGDLYAPEDVREVLRRLGMPGTDRMPPPPMSDKARALVALLHHVARAYRHTNILYEDDEHPSLRRVFQHKLWKELKDLLLRTGVVSAETRQTSGAQKTALRLRVPVDEILTGRTQGELRPGPAGELWKAIQEAG